MIWLTVCDTVGQGGEKPIGAGILRHMGLVIILTYTHYHSIVYMQGIKVQVVCFSVGTWVHANN